VSNGTLHNGRTVAEVLNEFKVELKDFAATRGQMLRAEMQEKVGAWKAAIPTMAVGAVLLLFALLVFTAGLVEVIALAFSGQPWAMAASCFIVFAIYALLGAVLALYGWRKAKEPGLAPERTLKVLKQDQIWLQHEARTEL
jgi:VIT1/CCC1 family predicted Fe2+/Mn2+ transporter